MKFSHLTQVSCVAYVGAFSPLEYPLFGAWEASQDTGNYWSLRRKTAIINLPAGEAGPDNL